MYPGYIKCISTKCWQHVANKMYPGVDMALYIHKNDNYKLSDSFTLEIIPEETTFSHHSGSGVDNGTLNKAYIVNEEESKHSSSSSSASSNSSKSNDDVISLNSSSDHEMNSLAQYRNRNSESFEHFHSLEDEEFGSSMQQPDATTNILECNVNESDLKDQTNVMNESEMKKNVTTTSCSHENNVVEVTKAQNETESNTEMEVTSNVDSEPKEPIVLRVRTVSKQAATDDKPNDMQSVTENKIAGKRCTRSSSVKSVDLGETQAAAKRRLSLRRQSVDSPTTVTPTRSLRPRRGSNATTKDGDSDAEAVAPAINTKLRTRSASVNDIPLTTTTATTKGRKTRVKSVDIAEEEVKNANKSRKPRRASDLIEDYSSSRRLTRKQKEMLEKSMDSNHSSESEKILLDNIDPLILLDREDFKGVEDPDEANLLQRSPASSIASSNATGSATKRGRPRKIVDKSESGSPVAPTVRKSTRLSLSQSDSPLTGRSKSIEVEKASVRSRRGSTDSIDSASAVVVDTRRTTPLRRTRSKSETSDSGSDISGGKAKRGRKKIAQIHNYLPDITEESSVLDDEPTIKPKRGRPKKQ